MDLPSCARQRILEPGSQDEYAFGPCLQKVIMFPSSFHRGWELLFTREDLDHLPLNFW